MARHLTLDLYRLVLAGHLPARALHRLVHEHLAECCEDCRLHWTVYRENGEGNLPLPELAPAVTLETLPAEDCHVSFGDLAVRIQRMKRRTRQRNRVEREMEAFTAATPEERPGLVESSRGRFRSRAFAELLVVRSREIVADDPVEAEDLASHVPLVLDWTPGAEGTAWAEELRLRALAWKANAVRVQGDLQGAERELLRVLADPLLDRGRNPTTAAEIGSIEASLRLAQRRFDDARSALGRALVLYRREKHGEGQFRVLVQQANLHLTEGDAEQALEASQAAASLSTHVVPGSRDHVSLVHCRVAALYELERYGEAERVLREEWPSSPKSGEPLAAANHHSLIARIAWGRGAHATAADAFLQSQRIFLGSNRTYEAALVSLDLAQVYLEAARFDQLRELAADLVPQFQARGVGRETLAALRLLSEAVAAHQLTGDLLRSLRGRMRKGSRALDDA